MPPRKNIPTNLPGIWTKEGWGSLGNKDPMIQKPRIAAKSIRVSTGTHRLLTPSEAIYLLLGKK